MENDQALIHERASATSPAKQCSHIAVQWDGSSCWVQEAEHPRE
jgi:hypothetical protein